MKILSVKEIQSLFTELSQQLKLIEISLDKHKANKDPLTIVNRNAWKLKEYSKTSTKKLIQLKTVFKDSFEDD